MDGIGALFAVLSRPEVNQSTAEFTLSRYPILKALKNSAGYKKNINTAWRPMLGEAHKAFCGTVVAEPDHKRASRQRACSLGVTVARYLRDTKLLLEKPRH
jgi:hypothetical protein